MTKKQERAVIKQIKKDAKRLLKEFKCLNYEVNKLKKRYYS